MKLRLEEHIGTIITELTQKSLYIFRTDKFDKFIIAHPNSIINFSWMYDSTINKTTINYARIENDEKNNDDYIIDNVKIYTLNISKIISIEDMISNTMFILVNDYNREQNLKLILDL